MAKAPGLPKPGATILGRLLSSVLSMLLRPLRQLIGGLFALMGMWVFRALTHRFPKEADRLFRFITAEFFNTEGAWVPFVAEYIESITGQKIDVKKIVEGVGVLGQYEILNALGEAFWGPMMDIFKPGQTGPIPPSHGVFAARRFLAANMEFQLGAWLLHFISDTMTFGSLKSLKDLPNAISWSYGLGWLGWMVLGVPFRFFITRPLEWYYNRLYRMEQPSPTQLVRWWVAGEITDEDLDEWMKRLGWQDKFQRAMVRAARDNVPLTALRDVWLWDKEQHTGIWGYLKNRGFFEDEILFLTSYWEEEREKRLWEEQAQEYARGYVEGVPNIDESEVRSAFKLAGYSEEEISIIMTTLDARRLRRRHSREREPADENLAREERRFLTQLGYAFRDGKISWQTVYDELKSLGYSDAAVYMFFRRVLLERYRRGLVPRWEKPPIPPPPGMYS